MLDFLLGILTSPISLTVFFILTILFVIDIVIYSKIYRNLKFINNEIDRGNSDLEPLKSIIDDYQTLIGNSFEKINSRSYLEAYFSDYQINLLAPYDCQAQSDKGIRVPVLSGLKFISRSTSIFILVGVLGTFLGLYYSLSALPVFEIDLEQFGGVMSGIQIAFNTSIIGMTYAIIINLITKIFNAQSYLQTIFAKLENYLANDLYYQKANQNPLIETIGETREILEKVYDSMSGFESLAQEFKVSKDYMSEFNKGLNKGVKKFNELYYGLKEIHQDSQSFISGFKTGVEDLNLNFKALFELWGNMEERQKEHNENLSQQLKQQDKYNQFLAKQVDILDSNLERANDYLADYGKQMDQLTINIRDIMKQESKAQIDALTDIKQDFKGYLNQSSKQFEKQSKVIKELNNKQDNLISACEDINQYNNKLIYKLKNISNKFDNDLEHKLNKLEEIFNQVQDDYNNSLSQVVNQFREYTDLNSNLIKDKFKNMDNLLAGFLTDIDFNIENLEDTIKNIDRNIFNLSEGIKKYNNSVIELKEVIEQLRRQRG